MIDNTGDAPHILFITLSCIGDVVMSTPVLRTLHDHYPAARIDVVADRRASQVLSRFPALGDIVHKDKNALFRGVPDLLSRLRSRRYDLIVDLRTDGLALLLRARKRLTRWQARPYGPHSVQRMMGVIRSLHGEAPIPPARVWLNDADRDYAAGRFAGLPEGPWLALGPGSTGARDRKYWPAANYAALADSLRDRFTGVILIGGPGDRELAADIGGKLGLPHVDATDTDLLQAAAVLERCALYVGCDSGPGHIAAAMSVPTLTLFGEDLRRRCLPWGGRAVGLAADSGYARDIPVSDAGQTIRLRLL